MTLELRCLSYNIGGQNDMIALMLFEPNNIIDTTIRHIAERLKSRTPPVSPVEFDQLNLHAKTQYEQLASKTFQAIFDSFDPHLLCLQELTSGPEHDVIIDKVKKLGYILLRENGLAIAYKQERFSLLNHAIVDSIENGALYADLRERRTGKIVRVVSDHLFGFNVEKYRKGKEVEASEALTRLTKLGDVALSCNLEAIDLEPKRCSFFFCGSDNRPDLVIYGLDANVTAPYIDTPSQVHAKRLIPFLERGYSCDMQDHLPTILDTNDAKSHKYDYIFCKALKGRLSIVDRQIDHVNDPRFLANPTYCMSDHLPVLATISHS